MFLVHVVYTHIAQFEDSLLEVLSISAVSPGLGTDVPSLLPGAEIQKKKELVSLCSLSDLPSYPLLPW